MYISISSRRLGMHADMKIFSLPENQLPEPVFIHFEVPAEILQHRPSVRDTYWFEWTHKYKSDYFIEYDDW